MRDRAFNIFYMGINIGAMFAPSASEAVSNWILGQAHLVYDARIPALANDFLKGKLADASSYLAIAQGQDPSVTLDTLRAFSETYINALSKSYHFGFGVACISLIISMLIFWGFRKHYKMADYDRAPEGQVRRPQVPGRRAHPRADQGAARRPRPRLLRRHLLLDGLPPERRDHDLFRPRLHRPQRRQGDQPLVRPDRPPARLPGRRRPCLACCERLPAGWPGSSARPRSSASASWPSSVTAATAPSNRFMPQMFQHFNPFFIVALTPLVVGLFAWLNQKGKEPSAPRKIGFGMLITAAAYFHPGRRPRSACPARRPSAGWSRRPSPRSPSTGSSRPTSW